MCPPNSVFNFLEDHDVQTWALSFLGSLKAVRTPVEPWFRMEYVISSTWYQLIHHPVYVLRQT